MRLVVPMAGFGDRYRRAGFSRPKPLIEIDGRPMIAQVLEMFPGVRDPLCIVNRDHAESTDLVPVLRALAPDAEIVAIDPHKDGPVETLLRAREHLATDDDVCVTYCDYGARWSFDAFRTWLAARPRDGAMTAYRGFHPHSLGPTLYAYMRTDGERVTEIREKHHFTSNRLEEWASSGLYWFRSGRLLLDLCDALVAAGERVNGEFYVSMLMQRLIEQGGDVGVYGLDRFFQWGTPEDLRDWQGWSTGLRGWDAFRRDVASRTSRAVHVIPMAGRGQRFRDQGWTEAKPFIDVAGAPMVVQATRCLPTPPQRVLIGLSAFDAEPKLADVRERLGDSTTLRLLDGLTEGQACTAREGLTGLADDVPVLVAPCDAGYVFDPVAWQLIEDAPDADLVVWTAKDHAPSLWNPTSYGWVAADATGLVRDAAVKRVVEGVPLTEQEAIVGTFHFPRADMMREEIDRLVRDGERVNGEFYLDTIVKRVVERGGRVRRFRVDKWLCWGTPDELRTFNYWNDVFREGRPL